MDEEKKTPPGPEPERVRIDGDWEDAVKRALKKPRPKGGWPKPEPEKGREDAAEADEDRPA